MLDKGIKETKGKCEEVKILETHNKFRIKKELLLIRKFLKMDVKQIKIIDETTTKDEFE